ncbi:bifunctional methylenetetrahydrofolate dehydrogenase/methenyltetrahydrofolate cyclohydrolase FolD [Candidatus Woesearchaeota archaeon]|nr:MAG: bifunctional methylenetetrahydrofolate dehydrogenase/methenyltetrahydrofolate cyclohydrolase FolD [Candidatus Woesearchaeota archaeon]
MMAKIIDGKKVAEEIKENLKVEVSEFREKNGFPPGLAVVQVGNNPASTAYVSFKQKACEQTGIYSVKHHLDESVSEEELLSLIGKLNSDSKIHGILVQLPLPEHIDEQKVISAIAPEKDVDGFHPVNVGRFVVGMEALLPCTPRGIIRLLESYGVETEGKHAVVVGRSNIVGKPAALMLLKKNATVSIAHRRTKNLAELTKSADILVVAVGRPGLVTGDMIKEGAVVIDVGINKVDGKLVGDVDFESASEKASLITPVPGGVGPMTIAMLLENTLQAARMLSENR